jgi:fluoroquinolone resistance protein
VSGCDLRGSDVSSLDPMTVLLAGAVVDWEQAVMIARNLGLDVRAG